MEKQVDEELREARIRAEEIVKEAELNKAKILKIPGKDLDMS